MTNFFFFFLYKIKHKKKSLKFTVSQEKDPELFFHFISFHGLSRIKLAWITLNFVIAWLKITSATYQPLKLPNMMLLRGDQNTCNQSSVNNIISVSAEGRSQPRIITGYLCSQWLEELWSGMNHLLIFMNKLFLHALKTLLMREFIFFLLFLKWFQSVCMREWEIVAIFVCVCMLCVCVWTSIYYFVVSRRLSTDTEYRYRYLYIY